MGETLKFYRLMQYHQEDLHIPGPRECPHIIYENTGAIAELATCTLCGSQFQVVHEQRGLTPEWYRTKRICKLNERGGNGAHYN